MPVEPKKPSRLRKRTDYYEIRSEDTLLDLISATQGVDPSLVKVHATSCDDYYCYSSLEWTIEGDPNPNYEKELKVYKEKHLKFLEKEASYKADLKDWVDYQKEELNKILKGMTK